MSPVAQTSSAVSRICAPAATKSSFGIDEPTPASLLDEDLVPVAHQLVHAGRGDRDPVLVVLDLAGDADLHARDPPWNISDRLSRQIVLNMIR